MVAGGGGGGGGGEVKTTLFVVVVSNQMSISWQLWLHWQVDSQFLLFFISGMTVAKTQRQHTLLMCVALSKLFLDW